MKRWRKAPGRVAVVKRRPDFSSEWPDPPMVPSLALRRCEQATTVEEVRAIVAMFLSPAHEKVNSDGSQ